LRGGGVTSFSEGDTLVLRLGFLVSGPGRNPERTRKNPILCGDMVHIVFTYVYDCICRYQVSSNPKSQDKLAKERGSHGSFFKVVANEGEVAVLSLRSLCKNQNQNQMG
jgi:hypothetical protein